jgi:hypothetical protein
MRKMMLLAAMVAITALMLAAAPAFAQEDRPFIEFDGVFVKPGDCGSFPGEDRVPREDLSDFGITEEQIAERFPGEGPMFFCVFEGEEPPQPNPNPNDDDGRDNDRNDNNRNDNNRNDNNRDVVPVFEITQDFEQEAESGDVDQSFDVSQTGDNSNQTVGIQGVANTGNAQNQIGIVDAGNGFGDFDGNNDDERFFFVDDNNDEDGFFFFFGDDLDNDRFFGDNDGGDFEFEDVGSTIEVSPTNMTSSDQQVNQAATAFGK